MCRASTLLRDRLREIAFGDRAIVLEIIDRPKSMRDHAVFFHISGGFDEADDAGHATGFANEFLGPQNSSSRYRSIRVWRAHFHG